MFRVTRTNSGTDHHNTLMLRGFELLVVDSEEKPISGVKVRVTQTGKEILATTLDENGRIWVTGHKIGTPCEVYVEGRGCFVIYGGVHERESPDDGDLPDYDPGEEEDDDSEGGCGADYPIPHA